MIPPIVTHRLAFRYPLILPTVTSFFHFDLLPGCALAGNRGVDGQKIGSSGRLMPELAADQHGVHAP
jgi:hypothetical protein